MALKVNSGISSTSSSYRACVSGLTENGAYGCVSYNDNSSTYSLEADKAYLHSTGTYQYELVDNSTNKYSSEYTIAINEGEAGSDPREGVDGIDRAYVLEFKLSGATLTYSE